ncbi:hypothetical protein AFLA70_13g006402 [Aspergillus flavus AF70]|nr:hypothetical protein AFLA70_13g006402 [Aspergillus flavus AF70]
MLTPDTLDHRCDTHDPEAIAGKTLEKSTDKDPCHYDLAGKYTLASVNTSNPSSKAFLDFARSATCPINGLVMMATKAPSVKKIDVYA